MRAKLIYVSLPYMTVGLVADDWGCYGSIIMAPPIARWTVGKTVMEVVRYFTAHDAVVYYVFDKRS
jgi:hypothetical protein